MGGLDGLYVGDLEDGLLDGSAVGFLDGLVGRLEGEAVGQVGEADGLGVGDDGR